VKTGLEELVRETDADEIIVVTDTYRHEDRLQSYRRVADVARMIEAEPSVAVGH
jgi:quinol monooxygenase YgiN